MVKPNEFEVAAQATNGVARVTVKGELDMATAPRLDRQLEPLLGRDHHTVVIDLRELSFVDSSGLRQLIAVNDRARAEGWELRLIRPSQEAALAVFRLTGADEHLPFGEV